MIYFIQDTSVHHIKIGYTGAVDGDKRLRDLQTGSPVGLVLLGIFPGEKEQETALHKRFASLRVHGEWFKPAPELLSYILEQRAFLAIEHTRRVDQATRELPLFLTPDSMTIGGLAREMIGRGWILTCPVCSFDYQHGPEIEFLYGSEDDRPAPPNEGFAWGNRGGGVSLIFSGECEHRWRLNFGFCKGNIFVWPSEIPFKCRCDANASCCQCDPPIPCTQCRCNDRPLKITWSNGRTLIRFCDNDCLTQWIAEGMRKTIADIRAEFEA